MDDNLDLWSSNAFYNSSPRKDRSDELNKWLHLPDTPKLQARATRSDTPKLQATAARRATFPLSEINSQLPVTPSISCKRQFAPKTASLSKRNRPSIDFDLIAKRSPINSQESSLPILLDFPTNPLHDELNGLVDDGSDYHLFSSSNNALETHSSHGDAANYISSEQDFCVENAHQSQMVSLKTTEEPNEFDDPFFSTQVLANVSLTQMDFNLSRDEIPGLDSSNCAGSHFRANAKIACLDTPINSIQSEFGGFISANGKKLPPVSEKSMNFAARLMQEGCKIDRTPTKNEGDTSLDLKYDQQLGQLKPCVEANLTDSTEFDGSESVNDNPLSYTAEHTPTSKNKTKIGGFMTASGKALPPVSEKSKQLAAKLMLGEDTTAQTPIGKSITGCGGFMSASGKQLPPVSEKSRNLAAKLMSEEQTPISKNSTGMRGFMAEDIAAQTPIGKSITGFGGFMSASGKQLPPVSEKSRKLAEVLMEDLVSVEQTPVKRSIDAFGPVNAEGKLIPQKSKQIMQILIKNGNSQLPTKRPADIAGLKQVPASFQTPCKNMLQSELLNTSTALKNTPFKSPFVGKGPTMYPKKDSNIPQSTKTYTFFPIEIPRKYDIKLCDLFKHYQKNGVEDPELLPCFEINPNNSAAFCFAKSQTAVSARNELLKDGANPKLATEAWVTNHYKWLVWKHASFARRFSQGKHLWCFDEILNSIKYRYEVEFSHMKRSCLKLIAEGDDSAAKHMVLCVSRLEIYEGRVSLELTDGWYCMNAEIDKFLTTLVIEGRIVLGMKLHVQNAHVSRFYLDDRQFFSMRDFGIAQRFKAGHLRQWYEDIEPG